VKRTFDEEADPDMLPEYDFSKPIARGRYAAIFAEGAKAIITMADGRRRVIKIPGGRLYKGPGAARRRKAWCDRIFGIISANGRPMSVKEIIEVLRKDGMLGSDRQIGTLVKEARSKDRPGRLGKAMVAPAKLSRKAARR